MPPPSHAGEEPTAHEAQLAGLLEQLLADARAGRQPDWPQLAQRHPAIVAELRELFAVAAMAEEVGTQAPQSDVALAPPQSSPIEHGFSDYELLEELGRGGMGVVYRARQQ